MCDLIKPKLVFDGARWHVRGWYDTEHRHLVEAACTWAALLNRPRINVRYQWQVAKVFGTLPWDGKLRTQHFSSREATVSLLPWEMMLVNTLHVEVAYLVNELDLDTLRMLPEFDENRSLT